MANIHILYPFISQINLGKSSVPFSTRGWMFRQVPYSDALWTHMPQNL